MLTQDRLPQGRGRGQFRAICQNAWGLASKKLNLAMLVERRYGPGTPWCRKPSHGSCRGIRVRARLEVKPSLPHTFDPGRNSNGFASTTEPTWKLPALAKYPAVFDDRDRRANN
jgi:hypothetical protein